MSSPSRRSVMQTPSLLSSAASSSPSGDNIFLEPSLLDALRVHVVWHFRLMHVSGIEQLPQKEGFSVQWHRKGTTRAKIGQSGRIRRGHVADDGATVTWKSERDARFDVTAAAVRDSSAAAATPTVTVSVTGSTSLLPGQVSRFRPVPLTISLMRGGMSRPNKRRRVAVAQLDLTKFAPPDARVFVVEMEPRDLGNRPAADWNVLCSFTCRAEVVRAFTSLQSANSTDSLPGAFDDSGFDERLDDAAPALSSVQQQLLDTENTRQALIERLNSRQARLAQQTAAVERLRQARQPNLRLIAELDSQYADLQAYRRALADAQHALDQEAAQLRSKCQAAQQLHAVIEQANAKELARQQRVAQRKKQPPAEWWKKLDFSMYGLLAAVLFVWLVLTKF